MHEQNEELARRHRLHTQGIHQPFPLKGGTMFRLLCRDVHEHGACHRTSCQMQYMHTRTAARVQVKENGGATSSLQVLIFIHA